jgi:transcriptional regulator with XRE-family HTH domain
MIIAERLRTVREQKKFSQGDVEKRTGLLRCYISRVENGHTVPVVETLEKLARALDMSLYQLLYDGEAPPKPRVSIPSDRSNHNGFVGSAKDEYYLQKLRRSLAKMTERDRQTLFHLAKKLANRKRRDVSKNISEV